MLQGIRGNLLSGFKSRGSGNTGPRFRIKMGTHHVIEDDQSFFYSH